MLGRIQYVQAFEHIQNAEDENGVSEGVVVDVPVEPVLVLLLRSQEQCKNLQDHPEKKIPIRTKQSKIKYHRKYSASVRIDNTAFSNCKYGLIHTKLNQDGIKQQMC